jgi:hypothetical protein
MNEQLKSLQLPNLGQTQYTVQNRSVLAEINQVVVKGNTNQANHHIVNPLSVSTSGPVVEHIMTSNPDNPIFIVVKDIVFNLIFSIPALRSKLNSLLDNPNLAVQQISTIYNEISSKIPVDEIDKLRQYVCQETTRNSLSTILQKAFTNIMSDGKIDMNDANHFLQLMFDIVNFFNQENALKEFNFTLSSDVVMFFLYFLIKCILILTLDGQEETNAVSLLDGSFKLISVAVMPISKLKCSFNPFSCCMPKK